MQPATAWIADDCGDELALSAATENKTRAITHMPLDTNSALCRILSSANCSKKSWSFAVPSAMLAWNARGITWERNPSSIKQVHEPARVLLTETDKVWRLDPRTWAKMARRGQGVRDPLQTQTNSSDFSNSKSCSGSTGVPPTLQEIIKHFIFSSFFSFCWPFKKLSKIGPLSNPPKISKNGPLGAQG